MRLMMIRISYVFLLFLLFQFSKQNDNSEQFLKCFPNNKLSGDNPQKISALMARSRLQFSIEFMKNVVKRSKSGENIFFSPHSVYQAMLLSLFVSNNETENRIKMALQLPKNLDKLDVLQVFKMDNKFEKIRSASSVSYELNNINKFFYEEDLSIRNCMKSLFTDELFALNFKQNPSEARQFVNDFVSNQTKNQINNLLNDNDVDEETKLILVNAMYFKGLWHSKFNPENTKKDVFYISSSRSSLVPMMRQKSNFKYLISEKLTAHIIQLPYKGEDISMYILLPPFVDPNGVNLLLDKLNVEVLSELVEPNYMSDRPVELAIPKFVVEQEIRDLKSILNSMGVGDIFGNTADLSALTGKEGIFLNDAVHKAKVSIDEEGTTAAAATAVFTFRSSRPSEPIKFICNHPFIYFLYDNVSRSILFIGVYNSPE